MEPPQRLSLVCCCGVTCFQGAVMQARQRMGLEANSTLPDNWNRRLSERAGVRASRLLGQRRGPKCG